MKKKTTEKGLFDDKLPADKPAPDVPVADTILDRPGRFSLIHKGLLHIDHEYQRKEVRQSRVDEIAAGFSWVQFGALLVAERPNKLLFVFDGQHRKLGADRLPEICEVPCMIYCSSGQADEAAYFLAIQKNRSPVTAVDNFRAKVTGQDTVAMACEKMFRDSNYSVCGSGKLWTVSIVNTIEKSMRRDSESARLAWAACCQLFQGKPVEDKIFRGFFRLEVHLAKNKMESLLAESNKQHFKKLTVDGIKNAIVDMKRRFANLPNIPGDLIYAQSIIEILNHKRRSGAIPALYEEITKGKANAD